MSSVNDLAQRLWATAGAGKNGEVSTAMQVRLDLTSDSQLVHLSEVFGVPKATLAQELLRAAIQEVVRSNPYAVPADVLDQEEIEKDGINPYAIVTETSTGRPYMAGEV